MSDEGDRLISFFEHHRGPMSGFGRGHGRPFAGVVEDTPALWVTWIVATARRMAIDPAALRLAWGDTALQMAAVPMTFGDRYFWICPNCMRRCEAVYRLGGRVACRRCHHLGYRSQTNRRGSPWPVLDMVFTRHGPYPGGRYYPGDQAGPLADELAKYLRGRLEKLLEGVTLDGR